MPTLIVDNFTGSLTRKNDGDINSGLAKYDTSWGYNPFSKPGNLTWVEQPTSILTTSSVMVAMKLRTEGVLNYVYAINYDNTLYKVTVNGSATADVDSPSVIGRLTTDSGAAQTLSLGSGMEFFGSTEKIFIGGNSFISKINFDGSSSASITAAGITSAPRPMAQFLGKIYFGNANNIGEIDSTETITTTAKLTPSFPAGTYVRDLDVTPDGNYLQITVSRETEGNQLQGDTWALTSSAPVESYKFLWNGTDAGYTAYESYDGTVLTTNVNYSNRNMTFGYDLQGAGIFNGSFKEITLPKLISPHFEAAFSHSNMLAFAAPEYDEPLDHYKGSFFMQGQIDSTTPPSLFRLFQQTATVKTDVVSIPAFLPVSNLFYAPNAFSFTNNVGGNAKFYYSHVEGPNGSPYEPISMLSKFRIFPIGSVIGSVVQGVWESQNQLFSKKSRPTEVRFYIEPLVSGNQFKVELVGSSGSSVLGGAKTFTVHPSSVQSGSDFVWWNPQVSPGYSWAVRITNLGSANWTGVKMELDYVEAGK